MAATIGNTIAIVIAATTSSAVVIRSPPDGDGRAAAASVTAGNAKGMDEKKSGFLLASILPAEPRNTTMRRNMNDIRCEIPKS